jgi:hypothetical protein
MMEESIRIRMMYGRPAGRPYGKIVRGLSDFPISVIREIRGLNQSD